MGAYNYQPAEVLDFSKGVTDDYVNSPPNFAYELFNFKILVNNSIISRDGTVLDSETDAQIPIGAFSVNSLISYSNGAKLFAHAATKLFYRNPTNYESLLGPSGANPFPNALADTQIAFAESNGNLIITTETFDKPVKVYRDNLGNYNLRTAGLPALAASPVASGTLGANAYVYAFFYKYEYYVGDQLFVDEGPVKYVELLDVNAPDVNNVLISSIPVLSNGATDSYDTVNIKVAIYRNISGGSEYYKVTEVTNGTTSYSDSLSDDSLQNNESIYTSGGVPDNDAPPTSKFCHTVNGVTYYAHIKVGTQIFPSLIKQSQAADPDSVPASFEDTLEDEITGISSIQDIPIVGCRKHIYRVDGTFDEVGRGGMTHRKISDSAGCISHNSMVQAEGFLFWFGDDGIYTTNSYEVRKVTAHLDARYKRYMATLVSKKNKIKGVYNPDGKTIYWTISTSDKAIGSEECDAIWCLDLSKGISNEMPCFFWNGGDSFIPTSLVIHNEELYRGDKKGYVLRFTSDALNDPKINPSLDPSLWDEETVKWKYTSVASNFGSSFVKKFANKILISCKNESNLSMAIKAINDDGKTYRTLTPIRWRKNFVWGADEFYWGDPNFKWSYGGSIEVDRRFPAKGLRFNYLQMVFENDYSNITNSDLKGLAAVDETLKTATLITAGRNFPSDGVDYYIYFEFDNYNVGFKITSVNGSTLVVEDLANLILAGNWKWQIKGYRKNERVNILGYSISWASTSRSHDTYNVGENGALA